MTTNTFAYLTVQPDWSLEAGSPLNFTCTLSAPIANGILYLAMLANSTLLNIVQAYPIYGTASISSANQDRIHVLVFDSLYTVVFAFTSTLVSDSGTYLCYTKTIYSVLADSNTVTVNIRETAPSVTLPCSMIDSTTTWNLVSLTSSESPSTSGYLALIISVVCGAVVGIVIVAVVIVLVVRHRSKQKALKRRLQILQTSRQQSLEETMHRSAALNDEQPQLPTPSMSRQTSCDFQDLAGLANVCFVGSPVCQRTVANNRISTDIYYDPPSIVSKSQILQNVAGPQNLAPENLTTHQIRLKRDPQLSTLSPIAGELRGTLVSNSQQKQKQSETRLTDEAHYPIDNSSFVTRTNDTNLYPNANIRPGVVAGDMPPSYNQVLLSNEAIAIFGDTLRIPQRNVLVGLSVSHTLTTNHFIANEIYNSGVSEHHKSNLTT